MKEEQAFYGKRIVLGSLMVTVFTMAIVNKTPPFYMTPICDELGFSITGFSVGFAFSALGAAVGAICAGFLINKLKLRVMMSIGIIITGVSFAALGIASQLWQFYLLLFLIDFGMGLAENIPLTTMISNWYIGKRGMMTGIVFSGMGVGGIFLSILIEKLIFNVGWQSAALISGIIIVVTALPACLFIFYKKPEDIGQKPFVDSNSITKESEAKPEESGEGVSKSVALRSLPFFMLVIGLLCMGIISSGVMVHIPNFLYGLDMNAGVPMGLLSAVAAVGALASGIIFDKLGPVRGILIATIIFSCGMICLYLTASMPLLVYLMVVCVGLSVCIASPGPPLLTSSVFGTKDYSSLFGIIWALFLVGCIIGPILSGAIFDATGSYGIVWLVFIGIAVMMFIFCALAVAGGQRLRQKLAKNEQPL